MNIQEAQGIVKWFTQEPTCFADYGKAYSLSQAKEAFAICNVPLPGWVGEAEKEYEKLNQIKKYTEPLIKAAVEKEREILLEAFK